jgi:putative Mg2+ transporter-C (MgtC) family protein
MWTEIISQQEVIIRIALAMVLALVLGIEREFKQQPAGIRTHILISVGSCMLMLLSIIVPQIYHSTTNDPARIAAQIVSGIGFLWAGAIMRNGLTTKGLTTAANIWVTAAIGMTVGAGLYFIAIISTAVILANLLFFGRAKAWFFPQNRYCSVQVSTEKKWPTPGEIHETIKKLPLEIISYSLKENKKNQELHLIVRLERSITIFFLEKEIRKIPDIETLNISENIKV